MKVNLPKLYSQKDPKWSNEKLGYGNTTIGQYGCFITCDAMVACYYSHDETPSSINKKYKDNNLFLKNNNGNLRVYNALQLLFNDIKEYRVGTENAPLTVLQENEIKNALDEKKPVIASVDFYPSRKYEEHFVIIVDYRKDTFTIVDSFDGIAKPLTAYGSPIRVGIKGINSYRIMSKVDNAQRKEEENIFVWKGQSATEKIVLSGDSPVFYVDFSTNINQQDFGVAVFVDKNDPKSIAGDIITKNEAVIKKKADNDYRAFLFFNEKIDFKSGVYNIHLHPFDKKTREWVGKPLAWFSVEIV